MKLKYKSIIIFIIIITTSSLPLSLYILDRESKDKISLMENQGMMNSRILSRSLHNILLMNGGDLKASSVDAAEMMSVINPLTESGLIYADTVLVSKNPAFSGYIFAEFNNEKILKKTRYSADKISFEQIVKTESQDNTKKLYIPQLNDTGYQFISVTPMQGNNTYCVSRLVFAKSMVLAPITKLRSIILMAMLGNTLINLILAGFLGRIISKPIETLIKEVEIIGSGNIDHQIKVKGKNEISRLATTFNHLAQILKLEIDHLKSKNIELVRINNLKDNFLANVTHELRTPLYGMIGIAESLIAGVAGELEEKAKYNLTLMINSGKRLSSLVNDILDYSQLKHEDIALNFTSINLYSIIRLIISITAPLVENKNLKIKTSIDPDTFFVLADENRLQQILINIIGNAIKFTDSGEIDISAELSDQDTEEVIVSVKDTGIGIPEQDQDKIFELFEQAGGSISKYKTGTGIGLSITKQLIELHGGKIWVHSEPGEGSCFYFTLKRSDKKTIFIKEAEANYSPDFKNENTVPLFEEQIIPQNVNPDNKLAYSTVMIVDDEPVNCQILINYLYLEGYILIPVASGQDALEKIDKGQVPDLLILDVMLPVMSGYDVCRKIREKYTPGELPILILTAKSSPSDLIIGFEAGTNDYLTKPVSKAELLARVNSLLQLKRSVEDQNELNLIRQEISIARRIQSNLLENKIPDVDKVSLAVRYFPMYEIGGDFYEISSIDDNKIGIFIADVSGHGIPAAFISAMLKVICNFYSKNARNPGEFMEKINETIYSLIEDQFITACYSVIDFEKGTIIQSNAGHWPMILYRQNTTELISDNGTRMPFGCAPDEKYENTELDLEINDRLIFYTDGIIEVRNTDNKMFGTENFNTLIKDTGKFNLEDFADNIIDSIKKWYNTSEAVFADDVTLLVLDINKLSKSRKNPSASPELISN